MTAASSSKRIVVSSTDRKSLDEAIDYVAKGWMPISTQVIKLVREKLQTGQYEEQRDELINDLQKDFSLFTWFLSKLGELCDFGKNGGGLKLDEYVRSIEVKKLIEVFNEPDPNKNRHKRDSALKPQALALKEAIAAITTAESAADVKQLDPVLANMCAGIRQLGVNLVAWNYPRIYARALEQSSAGKASLDQCLTKILGYSTMELGTEVALKWDQTGGLAAFIHNDPERIKNLCEKGKAQLGSDPHELFKCVELGEKVAKLVAPELHPESLGTMPEVISDVDELFGPGGMAVLRDKLNQAARAYAGEGDPAFTLDLDPEKVQQVLRTQVATKLVEDNTWVAKCSANIKEKFKHLYGYIDQNTVSPTAINMLVAEVIPNLGFTRGCVYLVESNRMRLNPIMRIGDAPLSRYRALDFSTSDKSSHPVVVALGYTTPLIQENVPVNGEFVSHVTGIFGTEERSGVLYLEMSKNLASSADRGEALLYFKAVREALLDCLNLRKKK